MERSLFMKKHNIFKDCFFLVPTIVVASGAFFGFQNSIPVFPELPKIEAKAEAKNQTEETDLAKIAAAAGNTATDSKVAYGAKKNKGTWKNGSYSGEGKGFGGTIQVKVVIKKGKITNVKILSHDKETPEYFSKAKAITKKIISAQSTGIDAISGATFSSKGILEAVTNALAKAKA